MEEVLLHTSRAIELSTKVNPKEEAQRGIAIECEKLISWGGQPCIIIGHHGQGGSRFTCPDCMNKFHRELGLE